MGWFGKTDKIKCPDGSISLVYKDLDDALPLALRNSAAKGKMVASASDLGNAQMEGQVGSSIKEILFAINERNQSQVLDFRNAYLSYMADPCGKRDLLERITNRIIDERGSLDRLYIQVQALLEMMRFQPENSTAIAELKALLRSNLDLPDPTAAAAAIEDARGEARTMLGDQANG